MRRSVANSNKTSARRKSVKIVISKNSAKRPSSKQSIRFVAITVCFANENTLRISDLEMYELVAEMGVFLVDSFSFAFDRF